MSQTHTVGSHKTTVAIEDDFAVVTYHSTQVVKWNDSQIVLNTGGHRTTTTKLRMNQASNQYNLGYRVYQKAFNWFVEYHGEVHEFTDHKLTLER